MYTRIVIPLDGSDIAEQALNTATEMARLTAAPLHLVRVLDAVNAAYPTMYGLGPMDAAFSAERIEAEREVAEQYLVETARLLEEGDLTVTHELRYGSATDGIVDALTPGDLLVMASHGRSGMSRWFLGSVAESVIRQSPVPVLLVRAAQSTATRNGHYPRTAGATP